MPGSLTHLIRRFFEFLTARPLSSDQDRRARSWLTASEQRVFFEQDPRDQNHGFQAAEVVVAAGFSDIAVIKAALLHDVGKRHAGLGVVGRSLASLAIKLRLPIRGSFEGYRDHGPIGADELAAIDAPALAQEFARHHHGDRPGTIGIHVWEVLQLADQPGKPSVHQRHR